MLVRSPGRIRLELVALIRDDDDERLARIEQMLEDLAKAPQGLKHLERVRIDATAARMTLQNSRRRLREEILKSQLKRSSRASRKTRKS